MKKTSEKELKKIGSHKPVTGRKIVGIAGGYCAGKNVLAEILKENGYLEIDVDKLGHEELERSREKILRAFGKSVLGEDGAIDRKKLGNIVFRDKSKLKILESIVHPPMKERVKAMVEGSRQNIVINAALLFPMELHRFCDVVICVKAPLLSRLRRATRRDGISLFQALGRIYRQRGICFNPLEDRVDTYIVWNSGDLDVFEEKAENLMREMGLF